MGRRRVRLRCASGDTDMKGVSKLIQELQTIFNAYIRERDKGLPCISCGDPYPSDAGHLFKKSTRPAMRFNPRACFLQCRKCNSLPDGNYEAMCKGIAQRYGTDYLTEVIQTANESRKTDHKWSRSELQELINYFKSEIKNLKHD